VRFWIILSLLVFTTGLPLKAQEEPSFGWDIDTLFDEPPEEKTPEEQTNNDNTEATPAAVNLVKQRGLTFNSSYELIGGLASGLTEAPWFPDEESKFERAPIIKMRADFGLDTRISEVFRVNTSFYFEIPNYNFTLGYFFADYNLYDAIFFRAGKYERSWGISSNFGFTNLLARVPKDKPSGRSFVFKADIPVGIGGFQLLSLTRADLMRGAKPGWREFGYGGKYNLALRLADIDLGIFYQKGMALRSFLSIKTTVGNTELYNEWLAAIDTEQPENISGAANIGIVQSFFNDKVKVNGEIFYNAEGDSFWYQPETSIRKEKVSPFIEGLNLALNLLFQFDGKASPRFFIQALYAPQQKSARLVPGIRLNPFPHTELYFAVPMALGSREGYYYSHTADPKDRPFSVVVLLSLKGSVRAGYYF
jgi:hypothetical protein